MQVLDKALGCFQGMMIADALSYPSMMRGRYLTLPWIDRVMTKIEAHGGEYRNIKPVLPFVWHQSEVLKPTPTYVSEFALFTAKMLIDLDGRYSADAITGYWREHIVEKESEIRSSVSERSAILNLRKGLQPPQSGNDHPHTYDDGFVARSIAIAIRTFDDADLRRTLLEWDGSITHAGEGLYAGYAFAASIAAGLQGKSVEEMIAAGIGQLPAATWVHTMSTKAMQIARKYDNPFAAIPELDVEICSRIYNYGNIAAETVALAYSLFYLTNGRLEAAIPLSYAFARLSDSVPAFVGALCGAHQGKRQIPSSYDDYINGTQGICVPLTNGLHVQDVVESLLRREGIRHD
ncbi:ADP-ribosylglycohydrolase family protein [Brevibacillus sp. SYP-B805]|uniref:ADP-ribosylglycohydrolase family protein n=1 Tax=Brevibacillus sp. SYP-B805 TaxID=1578199 RepID=UPI0013ECE706|nr:ADP-ribosylglycohydrolase family protein [Brevibacillus sp. SYP-B805]NGQ95860.1 ADP-ribosylglycohydrolase family protein [Brevibacillus sp. SYP-B805]